MMDEKGYSRAVKEAFGRLLKAIDAADPDLVEADASGDMIAISSTKSQEKVIVNTQRAVRQIWVAGNGLGRHFSLGADGRWLDDRDPRCELFDWVRTCITAAAGVTLEF